MGNSKTKPEQNNSKETESTNQHSPSAPQLQIRNCIRNVRSIDSNFSEMYLNGAGPSCGQANQSSVYTIDMHHSTPTNFTNPGYVSTEDAVKSQPNDGLPTYEEAITGIRNPIVPTAVPVIPVLRPTIDLVNEDIQNVPSSRSRRHRHRRHRHHQNSERQNENSQPPEAPAENRRQRHRRGFRLKRHLAKLNRRKHDETD